MLIIISCLLLFLLLFFPEISLAGSQYGVTLWLMKLLPTLLPFFIAIKLFQTCLPNLSGKRIFLLTGLLCGYPTGAALVADQYQRGLLKRTHAYFFLGFVNNPSPMFILIFCCRGILKLDMPQAVLSFILILLASLTGSLLFAFVLSLLTEYNSENKSRGRQHSPKTPGYPYSKNCPGSKIENRSSLSEQLDRIIMDSFILMLKIGGYVILFSILGQWIHYILPDSNVLCRILRVLIASFLEITSGVSYMQNIALSVIIKKVLTVTILTFGGLSATAQTSSILAKSGLYTSLYIINKGINSCIAFVLALIIFHIF